MSRCIDCLEPGTVKVDRPGYWPAPVWLCGPCWDGYQRLGERMRQMFRDAIAALEEPVA
jgi:hypothetical protein